MSEKLHKLFYETYTPELYLQDGSATSFAMPKVVQEAGVKTNGNLSVEWKCTSRHASKVRRGAKSVTCAPGCGCPVAQSRS
jgi:hypothetical protein